MSKKVFIVAGEPSGDIHAAELIEALRAQFPQNKYYSAGGPLLKECSEQVCDLMQIAVTGFFEVISYLPKIWPLFHGLVDRINEIDPDIVIFTDFPDFNFRLAKKVAKPGRKLVYFISPQLWAWRKGRINLVKQYFDKMLVIFPFEEKFYKDNGVEATFVGHPMVNLIESVEKSKTSVESTVKHIALLPGSRRKEVRNNLKAMVDAASKLDVMGQYKFTLLKHPRLDEGLFAYAAQAAHVKIVECDPYELFAKIDGAIACSGTVTFELAMFSVPTVVMYKMAWSTYLIASLLVKLDAISMANIILGKRVFPEFIQQEATAANLADALDLILNDSDQNTFVINELERLRSIMEQFDAQKAALAVVDE